MAGVETWIVVADGKGARIFEERVRLGPVSEMPELAETSHEDRHLARAAQGTVTQRHGHGRHGVGDTEPARRAEHRFLQQIAKRVDAAGLAGAYEKLILIAPPDALGALREALSPATLKRVEVSDPHERHRADAAEIRERIRVLRANA